MSIQPTSIGRVRVGGNDNNGAFFDPGISGAATDYSQQDAAQASGSLGTSTNSTTFVDVAGLFTAAMIGNAICLSSGAGVTVGYYFVVGYTNATTITLDRVSGTYTVGVWKLGGAAASWQRLLDSANAAGNKAVAGNKIYIRGAGTINPSSADYTYSGYTTIVLGSSTAYISIIGENGYPRLHGDGLQFYLSGGAYARFENLYFSSSGNNVGYDGFILVTATGEDLILKNLVCNTSNQTDMFGIRLLAARVVIQDVEIKSGVTSGINSGQTGISCEEGTFGIIQGLNVHHMTKGLVYTSASLSIRDSKLWKNVDNGFEINDSMSLPIELASTTIDANGGHGIVISSGAGANCIHRLNVFNTLITNHVGSGKFGINIAVGTTTDNDKFKKIIDYNWLYNNAGNYNGISAGAHDKQGVDPNYVDAANGDFTPQEASMEGAVAPIP